MSKPEKHIDNIYRDRLMNAEISPPPKAWDQISSALDNQTKSRRLIYYRRLIGAAAIIILLLSVGIGFLFKQQNHQPQKLTILPIDSIQVVVDSSILIKNQPIQENLAEEKPQNKTLNVKKDKTIVKEFIAQKRVSIEGNERENQFKITSLRSLSPSEIQYAFDWPELLKRTNLKKQLPFMLDDLLLNNDLVADASDDNARKNRWTLGGEFSPSYQNLDQGGSKEVYAASDHYVYDLANSNIVDESMSVYSGGLAVNYAISDKLSVQSGLYYFKQGQEIQNFAVLSNRSTLDNFATANSNSGIIEITSTEAIAENSPVYEVDIDMNNRVSQFDDALVQHFGFLEIPFLLKYKIVSTKLDVYILGGINANILVRNDVFIGPDSKQSVGHTNNINSVIYKSAFGISLEYPINKHFYFNLSPMFKYQLTPISKESSNSYKTRLIEYKTGISYRF
jgi:hypothetical protein